METITAQQRLQDLQCSSDKTHDQKQSPLFSTIPPEIRNQIFTLALSPYDDLSAAYPLDTSYRRPGYIAPKKTSTDLLRTCKLIYHETWFLPWTNQELIFYFTRGRRPAGTPTMRRGPTSHNSAVAEQLAEIYSSRGHVDEIEHVRIFAGVYNLEYGGSYSFDNVFCNVPHFYPKRMSITVRHTDWIDWQVNRPLRIRGDWVAEARLPNSVREVCVEFESTAWRQNQVDALAHKAAAIWYFERKDGALLVADVGEKNVMRWSGSSTWDRQRWYRHESRPLEIDYYVRTITFKLRLRWSKEDLAGHDPGATLRVIEGQDASNDWEDGVWSFENDD
ncbi:hypothetical protein MBLNU457_g0978t1 [Dothideomycetes sp. NU457]